MIRTLHHLRRQQRYHSTSVFESETKRWIEEYIIDWKICPFAPASRYTIDVWPHSGDQLDAPAGQENILSFLERNIVSLTRDTKSLRPNTFLVFPRVTAFEDCQTFLGAYRAIHESLLFVGGDWDYHRTDIDIQAFAFHPQIMGTRKGPMHDNYRFRSPWPTIHLIRKQDLDKARKGSGEVSNRIYEANEEKYDDPEKLRKIKKILESFQK